MAPPIRPGTVIGLDVGKPSHWACVVTREGELLASKPVLNRENDIDGLYAQYPGALVVVDQVRNIGSLALSRARLAGMPRAYLPGLAAHGASKLFAGDAKTDERDAMVIAKMALTESVESSSRPRPAAAACEDCAVRLLARRISGNAAEIGSLASEISALLSANETYRCLLTVPGIGPRTASELGISINIADFPKPQQASLVLRAGAAQPAVRHVDIIGVRVAAGQQQAEEPAHILVQLPGAQPQPMGRLLRALPRQGDAARQGPEGRGGEAAQGDLRGHEGQDPVRRLTANEDSRPGWVCVSVAKNAHRKNESPLDRTTGTHYRLYGL